MGKYSIDLSVVLSEVANAVVGQTEMKQLLEKILNTTMKTLNAEVCSIFLENKEDEPGVLRCVAGSGFANKIVDNAIYKIGEGFTGTVAKTGKEYNIKSLEDLKNLTEDNERVWKGKWDELQWKKGENAFRNLIALPLKLKGYTLGVIKVENKSKKFGKYFNDEDLVTFRIIANVVALAIENARLHSKYEKQSKGIQAALADVASSVVGNFNMKELLNRIVNTTIKTLRSEICSIFLEDNENNPGFINCVAGSGFAKDMAGKAKYKIGHGFTGMVAETGKEFNITSLSDPILIDLKKKGYWSREYDHLQYINVEKGFKNLIALPLKIQDQILGVIKVENKLGNKPFIDEDLLILRTIANVIALAIQNRIIYQKSEEQSMSISKALAGVSDSLVGRYNMDELLKQIIDTTMKTLNAEVCSIFLEDKEDEPGVLKCVAGSGFANKIVDNAIYKIGEGFTGTVAKTGKEYNIKSLEDLKNLQENGEKVWKGKWDELQWTTGENEFRNLIALPLKIKGHTLGVIKVENKRQNDSFTDDDVTILKIVANVIALTIEKAKLQLRIEDQLKNASAMAGHRINNQMARYDGIISKLMRMIKGDEIHKSDLMHILEELELSTEQIKHMIDEFRNYGKPLYLKKEYEDINNILEKECWYAEPPPEIEIISNFDYDIPAVKIDSARFSESIKELLNNAKRAILNYKGYGKIEVYTKLVEDQNKYKNIKIVIDDDGPGIPSNISIFDPFETSDKKRTGLGLATVKQNMEAHDGSISYVEKDTPGAKFEIILSIRE